MKARVQPSLPPGPRGHWLRGNAPHYEADRIGFLQRNVRDYGDVFSFNENTTVVNDPALVHEILGRTNTDFLAEDAMFAGAGDPEATAAEAASWMAARRKGWRGFNRTVATAHAGRMMRLLDDLTDGTGGRRVDVLDLMARASGCMVADYCFGADGSGIVATIEANVAAALPIMSSGRLLPRWLPAARNRRFLAARRATAALIDDLIARRRSRPVPEAPRDLLDVLLAAREPELSHEQVRDVLRVTLVASYGVPGAAIAWAVRELVIQQDVRRRVKEEACAWEGRDDPPEITELPYTQAVVKELLRAYTPTWLMGRTARREVQVGSWSLPPGHQIMFSPYLIHRDPRWWPEPDRVDPGRWLGTESPHARHTYLPFGAGPRVCLGTQLGMLQLTLAISRLVRRYRFDVADPANRPASPSALLKPEGLRARFVPREAEDRLR
ncbi:cytochrome P450 [Nonomuraea antimicrobica]